MSGCALRTILLRFPEKDVQLSERSTGDNRSVHHDIPTHMTVVRPIQPRGPVGNVEPFRAR